ncbi:unnamed protein product [Polarella glacialis]|uniref:Uncharacterized protein n=1 Tax=Polarella glacialis TaxID=89957 RepID=A0A813H9R8_POLGL|nr:unnamed protein product [Polarella glacialis]
MALAFASPAGRPRGATVGQAWPSRQQAAPGVAQGGGGIRKAHRPQAFSASRKFVSAAAFCAAAGATAGRRKVRVAAAASPVGAEQASKAVAEGRMITVEEATIRKALGALFLVLFLWQAGLVFSSGAATLSIGGSSYSTLALLASNALGFGASGFLHL